MIEPGQLTHELIKSYKFVKFNFNVIQLLVARQYGKGTAFY